MTKSYRIRTTPGNDKNIQININQDFDFLEILSLKLRQDDVYTRFCADYGVVVGRVITNGGYGIPNVNVSVFVPLSSQDENDPVISTLYPYKSIEDKNEDGYRYNLLPYVREYNGHTPTGTFPDRNDVLTDRAVLEVYEKYYKFTVKTNESGDFMIIGVPLGMQTIMMDLDLSNIGCFSLSPSDLIRLGLGAEGQFEGQRFKSSTDIDSLPQIINQKKQVYVSSFWGEDEICNIGITRADFDLRELGIEIKPQAIFMGSLISSTEEDFLKSNCKPNKDTGNLCDLTTGPGKILAIRQTINYDGFGRPILEQYNLPQGGNVIDDNGTWIVEVPMNLEYVTTDEFGNQILSNDPNIGIPTKGKYRFRIQYQNEDGVNNDILRADYLVPNVREYGWSSDGLFSSVDQLQQLKSYAFSLDWDEYANAQVAINCEDYFYEFNYNKVYTIANFIDRWKWGYNRSRHLGIKEITDRSCTTTNNRFPVNDGVRNFDFIFFLFNIFITIFGFIFVPLLVVLHVLANNWNTIKWVIRYGIWALLIFNAASYGWGSISALTNPVPQVALSILYAVISALFVAAAIIWLRATKSFIKRFKWKEITLPMISFPDCEACACESNDLYTEEITETLFGGNASSQAVKIGKYEVYSRNNFSFLADTNSDTFVGSTPNNNLCDVDSNDNQIDEGGYPTYFCYIDPEEYSGNQNKKNNKYLADGYGIRYAIVGYPTPSEVGMPIFRKYSRDKFWAQKYYTLSQSLNLANLRTRYFEFQNYIETSVNGVPAFTDNVMILMVDPGIINQFGPSTLLTFTNPDNIVDNNISGATLTNQFGTNSITASTPTATTINVNYVDVNGTEQTSTIPITGTSEQKEYLIKTGMEYFQVITGMTLNDLDLITNGTKLNNQPDPFYQTDWTNLIRKYVLNHVQHIYYEDNQGVGDGGNSQTEYINALTLNGDQWKDLGILFLVRGADPYTEKQDIEYDLSLILGNTLGSNKIRGQYHLNVPIQKNSGGGSWYTSYKTPESHDLPYATSKIYHEPFNFNVGSQFSAVTSNSIKYYSSIDKSIGNIGPGFGGVGLGYYTNGGYVEDNSNNKMLNQGNFEGGMLMAHDTNYTNNPLNSLSQYNGRLYSFTYSTDSYHYPTAQSYTIPSGTNPKLLIRSDRLPSSDIEQTFGCVDCNNIISQISGRSMLLHHNDSFAVYITSIEGNGSVLISTVTDQTNNAADFENDEPTSTDTILQTFTCEGMVPIGCYQNSIDANGNTTIEIIDNCEINSNPKQVINGCYKFVQRPFVEDDNGVNRIKEDINLFLEWKSRIRMMFGTCRGVFSHVFQNNWINGTAYMFTFKKQAIFDITGGTSYNFCGTLNSKYREGQGPVYYTSGTTNSFFYRASPYDGSNFVGQIPQKSSYSNPNIYVSVVDEFKGMNERNIFFPTTIMDLGPRDRFIREICNNEMFDGYLIDTIKSTSFNDTSDIMQLAIVSRLMNASWLNELLNTGDASIGQLFSRSEERLDGDITQLFSINSEYGITPFSDDNYDDNSFYIRTGSGSALIGVYFSSNTINRRVLSPGVNMFSQTPILYNYFGYPKSQEVPMYKWKNNDTSTIFGMDTNDWYTLPDQNTNTNGFYSQKYQFLNYVNYPGSPVPLSPYFNNTNTGQYGYIFNSNSNGTNTPTWPQGSDNLFIMGAPYHFYFGLRKGKSAINRYISKYFLNQNV